MELVPIGTGGVEIGYFVTGCGVAAIGCGAFGIGRAYVIGRGIS